MVTGGDEFGKKQLEKDNLPVPTIVFDDCGQIPFLTDNYEKAKFQKEAMTDDFPGIFYEICEIVL